MLEHYFACPYCGEQISILIEPGDGEQRYVEDCEVCCRPIDFQIVMLEGAIDSFVARTGDDV